MTENYEDESDSLLPKLEKADSFNHQDLKQVSKTKYERLSIDEDSDCWTSTQSFSIFGYRDDQNRTESQDETQKHDQTFSKNGIPIR